MAEQNPQNMTVVLDQKQIAELQKAGPKILTRAQEFEIETLQDYEASGSFLSTLEERQKKVAQFFDEPAKQANNVHKFITSLRATLVAPYQQAINLVKSRRSTFRQEEERKRLVLEEQARAKAKLEHESNAVEEAKQLAEIGETEAANIVLERAVNAPAPAVVVPSVIPKQEGISVRKVWKYRVVNQDLHKREFLILDESKAGAIVTNLGPDAAAIVGGIEVYQVEVEVVRKRS